MSIRKGFYLILVVYVVYSCLFIYRTSFVINGKRYFCLFDDAMISMRYAKNFANGDGIVWNKGEKVEGYTNFLWTIYMGLIHFLPIKENIISIVIQITSLILLIINIFYVKKITNIFTNNPYIMWGSVILTAFYLPINNWALQGMEVAALILIMNICGYKILNKKIDLSIFILLGVGYLIRPDIIVGAIIIIIFLFFIKKRELKYLFSGIIILLGFIISHTLFRLFYYNEILPNSYYLKMTGYPIFLRIIRGLYVGAFFIYRMGWPLFLLPFTILFYPEIRHDYKVYFLFAIFFAYIIYTIYIGGDVHFWWEGNSCRFISLGITYFFILYAYSLYFLLKKFTQNTKIYFIIILFSLLSFNSVAGPKSILEFLLIKPPLEKELNKERLEHSITIKKFTKKEDKIATASGIVAYFCDRYCIDFFGKNDKVIAKQKSKKIGNKYIGFNPGHTKWDYSYSIGKLKPDIIEKLPWGITEEVKNYLLDYEFHPEYRMYIKKIGK